ncbi:MAG: hypothetical protein KGL39_04400 [Patescibacteria group bacterium]|nr:hypothetical protein [Patescibacteria group bacterium]
MTDELEKDVNEFSELDPDSLHLVGAGANGFPALLAKAAAEVEGVIDDAGELTKARWEGFCGEDACGACKSKFGVRHDKLIAKAKLKAKQRNALPNSAFAIPSERAYPIHDESHARDALGRVSQFGTPEEKKKVRAAVHAKYPDIKMEKEGPSQESEQSFSIPSPESVEGQSRELHPNAGAVHIDLTPDGHRITVPTFQGFAAPSADQEGYGSTAPNKTISTGESLSQTRDNARKEGAGDGRGDAAPDGEADVASARSEAESQTDANTRKEDPGSPEWEAHDVNLAETAGRLIDELAEREKAEGSDHSAKSSLSDTTKAQLKSLIRAATTALDASEPISKEIEDMTHDELIKLLDERDAARRASKAKGKKKGAKKPPEDCSDDSMAKASTDDSALAKAEAAAKAAKKAAKAANKRAKTLEKALGTPGRLAPVMNGAGIAALGGVPALRQAGGGESFFKALDDDVQKAIASGDSDALAQASQRAAVAKLAAVERLHESGVDYRSAIAHVS